MLENRMSMRTHQLTEVLHALCSVPHDPARHRPPHELLGINPQVVARQQRQQCRQRQLGEFLRGVDRGEALCRNLR